jgi:hydroxymethylbilane synthase
MPVGTDMSHSERVIVVGSRGSRLALRQTELVLAELSRRFPDRRFRVQEVRTTGDRRPGASLAAIGGQGVFVKELETALRARRVDLAVHSLKDVPSEVGEGLTLAAVTERDDVRDAVVSRGNRRLLNLPAGSRVGTGSLRRAAQVRALRPDLEVVDLRGNVDTRLRKVEEGQVDAAVLAAAGLTRLGYLERAAEILDADAMLPAIGQGALTLEVRADDAEVIEMASALDHRETRLATAAERAFLARLGGGCRLPMAALGIVDGDLLRLRGLVADAEGQRVLRGDVSGPASDAEVVGVALAERLLAQGAAELMAEAGS